jgi:hypothetical protein
MNFLRRALGINNEASVSVPDAHYLKNSLIK